MGPWIQAAQRRSALSQNTAVPKAPPKKKFHFSIILMGMITLLCLLFFPQIDRLTVYTDAQKSNLLMQISRRLEVTAIEQARIVDPNYEWITYEEDLPPEIQNALKENALSSQLSSSSSLTSDSNLSWEVTYNGKKFYHNWPEDLDAADALLDVTFSSDGAKAYISSTTTLPDLMLFNVSNRGIVNPNLVSSDQAGSNEFYYNIVLPKGYTIRYVVPSHLEADGGYIARCASMLDVGRFVFFMLAGLGVCALFILVVKMSLERNSWLFSHLIRMKAIFAWLFLIVFITLLTMAVFAVSESTASGVLGEFFRSIGFSFSQSRIWAVVSCYLTWWFWLYLCSACILYIKYIFAGGFRRYLTEDTLIAALMKKAEERLTEKANRPLERWVFRNMTALYILTIAAILITCVAGALLFGPLAAVIIFLVDTAVIGILLYRMVYLMRTDYESTLAAANELIAGNFSYIKPKSAGMFQSLYNSLIDVKNEFQKALKDGLHSQNMKTQMISNVSHDLKTPVTGIKSYAELISMSDNLDDIRSYARHLDNYTERLSRLITDLFDVARASSGDIQLSVSRIDLSQLIEQVAAEWQEEFEKKKMQLILKLEEPVTVDVDPDKTVRMIENLFSNIRKYGLGGTRIFVLLKTENGMADLRIKNISKTALDFSPDEITERFVRGDKSRHEPGAGLGLAIVKSFAEVQNGSFAIEIDGDVFTAILNFPLAVSQPEETPESSSQTDLPEAKNTDHPLQSETALRSEQTRPAFAAPADLSENSQPLTASENPFHLPTHTPDGRELSKMIGMPAEVQSEENQDSE